MWRYGGRGNRRMNKLCEEFLEVNHLPNIAVGVLTQITTKWLECETHIGEIRNAYKI